MAALPHASRSRQASPIDAYPLSPKFWPGGPCPDKSVPQHPAFTQATTSSPTAPAHRRRSVTAHRPRTVAVHGPGRPRLTTPLKAGPSNPMPSTAARSDRIPPTGPRTRARRDATARSGSRPGRRYEKDPCPHVAGKGPSTRRGDRRWNLRPAVISRADGPHSGAQQCISCESTFCPGTLLPGGRRSLAQAARGPVRRHRGGSTRAGPPSGRAEGRPLSGWAVATAGPCRPRPR